MKHYYGLGGLVAVSAIALLAPQPAWAEATQITAVRLNPTASGMELILDTQNGQRPQVFTVPRGQSWVADIINAQLRIPEGTSFQRSNPAPGIASVSITQLDANSVRMTVTASEGSVNGEIVRREAGGISFNLSTGAATTPMSPSATAEVPPPAPPNVPLPQLRNGQPVLPAPTPVVPPFLPRAIAPPVGDIAVSNIDITPGAIDIGTAELVPRLVLRDAPVRDVLALLARVANLNVAFAEGELSATPAAPGAAGTLDPTISLDIENEPAQDVFNYVLRVTGLQANRIGRTIFIGRNLPTGAQDIIMRTLRLNQLKATMPETNTQMTQTSSVGIGSNNSTITRTTNQTRSVPSRGALQILEQLGANGGGATPAQPTAGTNYNLLRGLQVTAEGRTNTVTLIGPPKLVEVATAHLTQLDLRKRQVAVNVKIVEVNLNKQDTVGGSFSFGIANSFFSVDQGSLTANFGNTRPPSAATVRTNTFGRPIVGNPLSGVQPFVNPSGTELRRDPYTGEFLPYAQNQPGSIFSPGGSPTTPGITSVTPAQLPATASGRFYLDIQGIPRPTSELTIGGGSVAPFINPEGNLVEAVPFRAATLPTTGTAASAPQYFDFQGNPRLASELLNPTGNPSSTIFQGFTGSIQPLLSPDGQPVIARTPTTATAGTAGVSYSAPLFLDVQGIPRALGELTLTGGQYRPLLDNNELVQVGIETGLGPFIGRAAQLAYSLPQVFQYPRQFLASLQAQIIENNAKILTDPTLIVQEGSQAQVNLTQEYLQTRRQITTIPQQGPPITTTEIVKGEAGVILNVNIDQIDDNGFITMSVAPEVSVPSDQIIEQDTGNLLSQLVNRRRLETGQLRLRDGQTLILTGIIQDTDRQTVTKVPILGDLPLIGSLFRSRNSTNTRNEVIVLVTPQIMDDSDQSNFGYSYSPSSDAMQTMQRR